MPVNPSEEGGDRQASIAAEAPLHESGDAAVSLVLR
jgi:hypothetical protein